MSLTEDNKAIQVVGFDNKKRSYRMWVTKFRTPATLRGYSLILVEKKPKKSKHNKILKDTKADKEIEKLHKVNKQAYCKLILVCQGPIAFNIMRKYTMDDQPKCNTFLTWNTLKEKFNLQTSNEKLQLKEKFTNSKLIRLEIIPSQLDQIGHKIMDKDFITLFGKPTRRVKGQNRNT